MAACARDIGLLQNRTIDIVFRSVDTELASDSRARITVAYSFALRQGMKLQVTEIPSSYRPGGFTTTFEPAKMKALFAYGERCAAKRRVWGSDLTGLNRVAGQRADSSENARQCPVRAVAGE